MDKYLKEGEGDTDYLTYTSNEKAISEYASIPLLKVGELNCFIYEMLLHDSMVYNLQQSENGQEFLKAISRITKTDADIEKIRQKIK